MANLMKADKFLITMHSGKKKISRKKDKINKIREWIFKDDVEVSKTINFCISFNREGPYSLAK